MGFLEETAIFLTAAVIAVTLFNKAGFSSVLGYLIAGIVIGPWGLGLITRVENILSFSEIGVVLLLFLIGMELQPARLWVLRRSIFGTGLAQVAATTVVLGGIAMAFGVPGVLALLIGFGLSQSSTAVVLQALGENRQMNTVHGRTAFSILLFQDMAVIPVLALLPLLNGSGHTGDAVEITQKVFIACLAITALILVGHFLLRPVFRMVAATRSNEIFSATSLLLVIGSTLLMESVGLSLGLGAFIAGVLLADSEYRHEIEANIEPFKGLLLGLFFIAVGMSVNIGLIVSTPGLVFGLALGLLVIKFAILYGLARAFRIPERCARNLAFAMPQGGEFAFVLFTAATAYQVLSAEEADLLILIVSLSMALTPFIFLFNERVVKPWFDNRKPPVFDRIDDTGNPVIIAGFGRVGQIVGRLLRVKQIPFTALEINQSQVDFVRKFGGKLYYGDARRIDLLRAAHVERARAFVIAVDDIEASIRIAETVKHNFPGVPIYARARNRHHAHRLMDIGVTNIEREAFHSSIELAAGLLRGLGYDEERVRASVQKFKQHDSATLIKQHAIHHDEKQLIQSVKDAAEELEALFEADEPEADDDDETGSRSGPGLP